MNECILCPEGQYSFSKNDSYCHPCPENVFCENGSHMIVNPGYWRSDYFSTVIVKCLIIEACLGGDLCEQGYEGLLCDTCSANETSMFFKTPQNNCQVCQGALSAYIIMGLVIHFILFFSLIFYISY